MKTRLITVACGVLLLAPLSTYPMGAPPQTQTRHDGPPNRSVDVSRIPNAVPRLESKSKYGNPPIYEVFGQRYHVMDTSHGYQERGIASWYGTKFHDRKTSSGEPYDMFAMTAAHTSLPLPTYVKVRNLENNREIIVKVNDRGPFAHDRIIDLSYVAAKKLGMIDKGTAHVEVTAIDPKAWRAERRLPTTSPPPTTNKNKLYMQVAAFSDMDKAKALAHEIQRAVSHNIQIQPVRRGKERLYRVRVGPIEDSQTYNLIDRQLSFLNLGTPVSVVE